MTPASRLQAGSVSAPPHLRPLQLRQAEPLLFIHQHTAAVRLRLRHKTEARRCVGQAVRRAREAWHSSAAGCSQLLRGSRQAALGVCMSRAWGPGLAPLDRPCLRCLCHPRPPAAPAGTCSSMVVRMLFRSASSAAAVSPRCRSAAAAALAVQSIRSCGGKRRMQGGCVGSGGRRGAWLKASKNAHATTGCAMQQCDRRRAQRCTPSVNPEGNPRRTQ